MKNYSIGYVYLFSFAGVAGAQVPEQPEQLPLASAAHLSARQQAAQAFVGYRAVGGLFHLHLDLRLRLDLSFRLDHCLDSCVCFDCRRGALDDGYPLTAGWGALDDGYPQAGGCLRDMDQMAADKGDSLTFMKAVDAERSRQRVRPDNRHLDIPGVKEEISLPEDVLS